MQSVTEQRAEAVEHALAGETQCVYCRRWKQISLMAFTLRGKLPYCPLRSDEDCDRIFRSMSQEQIRRVDQMEADAERIRTAAR